MQTINIPVKIEGGIVTLPFILFTGWTLDERRQYAKDLRYIKTHVDQELAKGGRGFICFEAMEALAKCNIAERSASVLSATLPKGRSLSANVWRQLRTQGIHLDLAKLHNIRSKWLQMQIGMVDVPEFF